MRITTLFIAIIQLNLHGVIAQTRSASNDQNRFYTIGMPLVMVDSFKTGIKHLVLDPQKIESINIFKDSSAIARFGEAGKSGVIVIHPKPATKLLRIDKILNEYKLSEEDKKLRVCINNNLIEDPGLVLIEQTEIENVAITTERHWVNFEDANSGEKFINIITKSKDKNH